MANRTTLADALHQAGQACEASKLFEEAEAMQAKRQEPGLPKLYSVGGYCYCDLLLAQGHEQSVIERAKQTLEWGEHGYALLEFALDNLSLGCAYAASSSRSSKARAEIAEGAAAGNDRGSGIRPFRDDASGASVRDDDAGRARRHLDAAVEGLRRAGTDDYLPRGLFARAAFHRATGEFYDAATDLDEALDIAERGEMRLHLTDYHLESARLMLTKIAAGTEAAVADVMHTKAEEHYAAAKKLVENTGVSVACPRWKRSAPASTAKSRPPSSIPTATAMVAPHRGPGLKKNRNSFGNEGSSEQ